MSVTLEIVGICYPGDSHHPLSLVGVKQKRTLVVYVNNIILSFGTAIKVPGKQVYDISVLFIASCYMSLCDFAERSRQACAHVQEGIQVISTIYPLFILKQQTDTVPD